MPKSVEIEKTIEYCTRLPLQVKKKVLLLATHNSRITKAKFKWRGGRRASGQPRQPPAQQPKMILPINGVKQRVFMIIAETAAERAAKFTCSKKIKAGLKDHRYPISLCNYLLLKK